MLRSLKARRSFFLGRLFAKLGRYETALAFFERVVKSCPKHLSAILYVAWCHEHLHRSQLAIAAFNRALQIDPNCAYAHRGIGKHLVHSGRFQEGADAINRALRMEPTYSNDVDCLKSLGYAYAQIGQLEDALKVYRDAELLRPLDAETAYWHGQMLMRLERHEQAEQQLRKAAALDSQ